MYRKLAFIFLCFTYLNSGFAQETIVRGIVSDYSNNLIENATIVVNSSDVEKILTYGITDAKGNYNLKFNTSQNSKIVIKLSHINYEKHTDTITITESLINYNVKLHKKTFELDDIVITAKRIKDTMSIKTDSLNLTERSTLRNILDKTEGFIISEEGGITFQGEKINKILINKKEVFVNQNKIALDNLEFGIMEDLQLINNYRDKFNMDFDNFTNSVININTKSDFKGVLKLFGDVALGYKDKYQVKLRSFLFSDKVNMYLTSNTNSIGDKEFSFKDISDSFKDQSSGFFKKSITNFFSEDDLLKSAFDSNTSLTLRKENESSRLGFVAYFNNIDQTKTIYETTQSNTNVLIKDENRTFRNIGNSTISNFTYQKVLSKKTVFSAISDFAYTNLTNSNVTSISNFVPEQNNISESNSNEPNSILSSSTLSLKTKLNKNLFFTSSLEYDIEDSKNIFNSHYSLNSNQEHLQQTYSFKNQFKKVMIEFDYRLNKYLSSSLEFKSNFFDETLNYKSGISRKGLLSEIMLQLRGQKNNKIEYKIGITPQIFKFDKVEKNITELEIDAFASYKTNENNRFRVSYTKTNDLFDLYNNIDTLIVSFNNRLVNTISIENNITNFNSLDFRYDYSSIIKTQSFSTSYSISEEKNYLQPIFENEQNSVFFYSNKLISNKKTQSFNLAFGKGYYLSKNYHLLRIRGGVNLSRSKFPTYIPNEAKYEVFSNTYNLSLGIEPKKFFLDEVILKAIANNQSFHLDDSKINNNSNLYIFSTFKKQTDKFEFSLIAGQQYQKNQGFKFRTPILNLNTNLKINDRLNIFLKSKYLFHLFNFKNIEFTNFNAFSDGNLIYNNYNRSNLNYIIIGTSYKL